MSIFTCWNSVDMLGLPLCWLTTILWIAIIIPNLEIWKLMIREIKLHPKGYVPWVRLFKTCVLSIHIILPVWGSFFSQSSTLHIRNEELKGEIWDYLKITQHHTQFGGEGNLISYCNGWKITVCRLKLPQFFLLLQPHRITTSSTKFAFTLASG